MILIMLYDFIQVVLSKRRHNTKNDYLSEQIQFSTIYLLQKSRLNHNNYSNQKINMSYFIQANEHNMSMHAKIGDLILYGFL
jgi:hypothetical protein